MKLHLHGAFVEINRSLHLDMCLTLVNAMSVFGQYCIARNSPVTICATRQIPGGDPNFHQPLIVDGVGKSTRASFAILNRG
jgi:hypothetical protein